MNLIREIKIRLAARKLAKLVEQRRNSFEVQDFRKRRESALKYTRREAIQ